MNLDLVRLLSERMAPGVLAEVRRGLTKASLPIYKEFDADREMLVPYMRVVHELHDCVDAAYSLVVPAEQIVWTPFPDSGELLTLEEFANLPVGRGAGMGFYATESQRCNLYANRHAVAGGLVRPEFTHVWYRKGVDYGRTL